MAEDLFASSALETLGLYWRPHLQGRWDRFQRGAREHQYGMWGLFCLALWQRHVLGNWRDLCLRLHAPMVRASA
jgi:hypothetical protein